MVNDERAGTETPDAAGGPEPEEGPDLEYVRPPGRFDSWERVDWIIAAARLIGLAVIVLGVANTISLAAQSNLGQQRAWLQFASFAGSSLPRTKTAPAAGSASTGLLLIVAAEILDHLLGRDDR